MTPYNDIFQLHNKGLNNSQISAQTSTARGTVIDVLKRAKTMNFVYDEGLTDVEIHRILHPPLKRAERYYMPDMGSVIFEIGIPKRSIAKVWSDIKIEAEENAQQCYSKSAFQGFIRDLKGKYEPLNYDNGIAVSLIKNAFIDPQGSSRHLVIVKSLYGGCRFAYVLHDLKTRSWIRLNTELLKHLNGIPAKYMFCGHFPKAWNDEMIRFSRFYMVEFKVVPKDAEMIGFGNAVATYISSDTEGVLPEILAEQACNKPNQMPLYTFSTFTVSDSFAIERKQFSPLPQKMYEMVEEKHPTVQMNFHVEIDGQYYSVPFELRHERFTAYISEKTIEMCLGETIVCVHDRINGRNGKYSTFPEHMPESDDEIPWNETSGRSLRSWARKIGPNTFKVIHYFLSRGAYEAYGYKICTTLLHQSQKYGNDKLEAACKNAIGTDMNNINYNRIIATCEDM